MVKKKKSKKTIGWKEQLDLKDLGLNGIEAKVDTGATTSVLHCSSIELVKIRRKSYVKFVPLDPSYEAYTGVAFVLPFHRERRVKNSFGLEENRYVIRTTMRMFNKKYEIELSLRDRSSMEMPMLLGRRAIRQKFVVDVSKTYQSNKYLNKKKKSKS